MQPAPEPISALGPSHAAELLRCAYRVAWDRDAGTERATPHVKAILGTIGHRLCERAAVGSLGEAGAGWETRFDTAWDEEAVRAFERSPELGDPQTWPGFNLQKALWRSKARSAVGKVSEVSADSASRVKGAGVEVALASNDGRLKGVADVVIRRGDDVEIRDLKSGRTLDDSGAVSEAYRIQLLLYGSMYEDTFGVWPSRLVVDPIVRGEIDVEADRNEALRYRRAVTEAIERFEAAISSGDAESLADPSASTCRFCLHVGKCRPFWVAANKAWGGVPRALRGTVTASTPGTLNVTVTSGTIEYGDWKIGGVGEIEVRVGDVVEVVGFEWRGERRLAHTDATEWRVVSRSA